MKKFKEYGIAILIIVAIILALIPGMGFMSEWVNKNKKKQMEDKHKSAMDKIQKNTATIDNLKKEMEAEQLKIDKNDEKITQYKEAIKKNEEEITLAKGNIGELDKMANDVL